MLALYLHNKHEQLIQIDKHDLKFPSCGLSKTGPVLPVLEKSLILVRYDLSECRISKYDKLLMHVMHNKIQISKNPSCTFLQAKNTDLPICSKL